MSFSASARATFVAALTLLLLACSTGFDTRPGDLSTLPEDYGVVVVQFTNNTDRLNPKLNGWTGAHVARIDQPDNHFLLKPAGSGLIGSRIFVGALPPGRYRFHNLVSQWPERGQPRVWMEAPATDNLGSFRIEPGQLTSLGTVLYQPMGAVRENGRWKRTHTFIRYDQEEVFDRFMRDATPDLYERLGGRIHSWDIARGENVHEQLADTIRRFAVGTGYHWLGDGEIAMTGPIGSVFRREGPGQWRRIETGVNHQLTAMVRTGSGYVVAGERGLVMHADSLDGEWRVLAGPGRRFGIEWMGRMDNGSLYAIAYEGRNCTLFHVDQDLSEWRPILAGVGFWDDGDLPCWMRAGAMPDDGLVVFEGKRRVQLDNQGRIQLEEDSKRISIYRDQPNGVGIAVRGAGWTRPDHQIYTFDGGATWHNTTRDWPTESDRIGEVGIMLVLPDHRALALSYKGYVDEFTKRVLFEKEPRLRLANADGKVVHWGEKVDAHCRHLLPEISTEQRIFARCSTGRLIVTEDLGETWTDDFVPGEGTELDEAIDLSEPTI